MKTNKKGFTLIELMIVVAIIGILAAIAIPKFADLISKSKEGATKGGLSTVRSALQVYYGDNEGWFPTGAATAAGATACMDALTTNAKYINEVPIAKLPGTTHADVNTVITSAASDTGGGWHYEGNSSSASIWGNFAVNCEHEDIKGRDSATLTTPWSSF
jgi:prepilin-type N-terminal cleavage/methylation domain-containing protein